MQPGEPALEDVKHIPDDRAGGRSDQADPPRQERQLAFAIGPEQALGFQLFLQLFESKLQRAGAARLEQLDVELVLSALLVNAEASAGENREAILRAEFQQARVTAEENALQLALAILQAEVVMSARGL